MRFGHPWPHRILVANLLIHKYFLSKCQHCLVPIHYLPRHRGSWCVQQIAVHYLTGGRCRHSAPVTTVLYNNRHGDARVLHGCEGYEQGMVTHVFGDLGFAIAFLLLYAEDLYAACLTRILPAVL